MMKKKQGKQRANRMFVLYVLLTPWYAVAEETPSLELLEFLADWEISENEWQDPLDFMQGLDELDAEAQRVKVEEAQDAQ
ncbi:hypothetical protein MNBD_GAMMA17-313 [hydrothermal vent metagenome]|uniref:Uncharacterized protein n=1 Tax=hydrothermal vent metagenome TaxID=652676 RepID=A0A3B0ZFI1_9ZZZZ